MLRPLLVPIALCCALPSFAAAQTLPSQTLTSGSIQMQVDADSGHPQETLSIKIDGVWTPALAAGSAVHVRTDAGMQSCVPKTVTPIDRGLLLTGECGVGKYEQRVLLTDESDVVNVQTRLQLNDHVTLRSAEDRYDFLPPLHTNVDTHNGPLDFVWSQNIKREADDLIPTYGFKSPAVMMQQGSAFVALLPHLSDRHVETLALDLDVTTGPHPWIAFGAIPAQAHDHSYFRRDIQATLKPIANTIEYSYSLVLSAQPPKLGYRRVVRQLWRRSGHPELLASPDLQRNALRPELESFASWREEAWKSDADRVYIGFDCGSRRCGTLESLRNFKGDWEHQEPDAWFNAWFQTLRTAYGWYVHGRATHDPAMMAKAESILNLVLTSPQHDGAFSSIYLVKPHQWLIGDGWASYSDSYHAFSMSWTAYWMLRWAEDLTPERKAEILRFVKPYGDFLLQHQKPDGLIPSWYEAKTLEPREEFRDFNAENPPSALLLAELGKVTGEALYTAAADRAMNYVVREVLPRQRWYDYETFLSCARKPYGFFDSWTAQYPQNNLAEIQAPEAMLALYQATQKREYLERGTQMLDYLLLTQQVWSNPHFTPRLLGGFTTQNTDAEWSDARQGYAAVVLADYYRATGEVEYLERAVAAARSTFAVAPWENWAHTGYPDEPGALTGFHWGTGSAMTTVELLQPELGDALIDLHAGRGVGFDDCTIRDVTVKKDSIAFRIESPASREFQVRFRGVEAGRRYRIQWNGGEERVVAGSELISKGLRIRL
jgi:hypothetical protein